MIRQVYEPVYKSFNKNMRIKNLGLTFTDYLFYDPDVQDFIPDYDDNTIYIDGGYIGRFEIGSVDNTMEYLDDSIYANSGCTYHNDGVNQFEVADFVSLHIVKEANQQGNEDFASTFDFIAHSVCSIIDISFDLIDMKSQDPEVTIKHYDFNVDWKSDPGRGFDKYNLNQKVGMDAEGGLYLVISEKYDLKDVFHDIPFIDMPDVIEYDDKYEHIVYPLLAILNPNKLRVLHLDTYFF